MVENYDGKYSIDLIHNGESKNTWTDFHLVPTRRPDITIPKPDIQRVVLPGTNKVIDIIASPSDKVIFGIRQGTWEFAIDHDQWSSWDEAYRALAKYINGKRMVIWLDDGTVYGYSGRLRVSGYTPGASWSTITIEYQLDNGRSIMGRIIAKKNISQNGTYNAKNEGAIGYEEVVVDVGSAPPTLSALTCTSNGYYSPSSEDEYYGYSSVTVNVPSGGGSGVLESIDITNNGVYRPTSGVDGYNEVNVFVQPNLGTITCNQNGTYDAKISGYDGFDSVTVSVEGGGTPAVILPSITLSENMTYVASYNGYDGVAEITVNVPNNYDRSTDIINGTVTQYENSSITIINPYAFYQCSMLTSVSFPVCSIIRPNAFCGCSSLSSISFPVCKEITDRAFLQCFNLTSVSFPVCSIIWSDAFRDCSGLSFISFPSCKQIGYGAFYDCRSLSSISFPVCSTIGIYAFKNCRNLSSISFPVCSIIGSNAFENCSNLTSISFPVCSTISEYAFYNCNSLTSVYFPLCSMIGEFAFYQCVSLSDISFPSCEIILKHAFNNCFKLASISFPACSIINASAFVNCYRLLSLYLLGSSVCELVSDTAFNNTPISNNTTYTDGQYGTIYIPASLYDEYISAPKWSDFSSRFASYTGT